MGGKLRRRRTILLHKGMCLYFLFLWRPPNERIEPERRALTNELKVQAAVTARRPIKKGLEMERNLDIMQATCPSGSSGPLGLLRCPFLPLPQSVFGGILYLSMCINIHVCI